MIEAQYDWTLVLVSYAIAVFGSYTGLNLAIRIPKAKPGRDLMMWLGMAAVAIGGAIWSMHYIGMMAVDMQMPVSYDLGLTIVSMLLAVIFVGIGLFIVGRGASSTVKLLVGGAITGMGVAAMHYTGMASMNMPATVSYDTVLFTLSLIIAVVAAIAALWLAFNLRGSAQRIGSAFVMGLAVCGMHYTGMAAMKMTATTPMAEMAASGGSSYGSSITIFVVTAALMGLLLFIASRNAPKTKKLVF
ncbi:MHYT domain-containing protein [Arenicella xantha]|uniref:NO-binding membrane sensor protein with MHYT domain n=1 Tax=Arenicella xantha TaxID=644221 RepID=A0A395JNM5_9GAMM|nr:MHYT domain-containing protein [Arenicella xantha]RBP51164.1 NO-binding membrane sensor protein with MHYT domain [Arenicella xantha]